MAANAEAGLPRLFPGWEPSAERDPRRRARARRRERAAARRRALGYRSTRLDDRNRAHPHVHGHARHKNVRIRPGSFARGIFPSLSNVPMPM
jgi:hypothetical protein